MKVLHATTLVTGFLLLSLTPSIAKGQDPGKTPPFTGLGTLYTEPSTSLPSEAWGVSADGSVVVGFGCCYPDDTITYYEAFRWTLKGGMKGLGILDYAQTYARGVNADGSVVVGGASNLFLDQSQAFRWTATGGMVGLGDLPGGFLRSVAEDVSDNGLIVVGAGNTTTDWPGPNQAFRWTAQTGMVGLGYLPGGDYSYGTAISGNGSVIVGQASSPTGNRAFRWSASTGMLTLGGGGNVSPTRANDTNFDGTVIVGAGSSAIGSQAFRWTAKTGALGLGILAGDVRSSAYAVNADGSTVVGASTGADPTYDSQAFVWTKQTGMRSVADVLTTGGVNLGAWQLREATAVSAKGNILVGNGTNPSGLTEAWWASIGGDKKVGLISASTLSLSLSSAQSISHQVNDSVSNDLSRVLAASAQVCPAGKVCAFGGSSDFDSVESPTTEAAAVYAPSKAWSFGARIGTTARDAKMGTFDGESDERQLSTSLFASWRSESGLLLYGAAVSNTFDLDVERGYLNGVGVAKSQGEREGRAYALSFGAGWTADFGPVSFSPFAQYEYLNQILDGYVEYGGPFPAEFYSTSSGLELSRVGLHTRTDLADNLALNVETEWVHRFDGDMPDVTGRLLIFESDFSVRSGQARRDWALWRLGLSHTTAGMDIRANLGASTQFGEPDMTASVNLTLQF